MPTRTSKHDSKTCGESSAEQHARRGHEITLFFFGTCIKKNKNVQPAEDAVLIFSSHAEMIFLVKEVNVCSAGVMFAYWCLFSRLTIVEFRQMAVVCKD